MRKNYDNDFKVMIVELLNSGTKTRDISEEYGVDANLVRRWRRDFNDNSGDFSKKREVSLEEQELKRLRKELKDVTMERDILKKAVGIFSKSGR